MSIPPPSYADSTQQHASVNPGLSFYDFLPQCLDRGGILSKAKFEQFPALVDKANQFLAQNPHLEVKTCESFEKYCMYDGQFEYDKMQYTEFGKFSHYIRALRLWLVPRSPSLPPQKIGYYNNIPCVTETGMFNMKFENLQSVIQKMNNNLQTQPLAGKILNMETQEMKLPTYDPQSFNPDRTSWSESNEHSLNQIFVLRVFFEHGSPANELIGCIDFVPNIVNEGGFLSKPIYEPVNTVISKASAWCSQNSSARFCNAQTIKVKIKSEGIDTGRMHYNERKHTSFLYVLRLVYTQPIQPSVVPPTLQLTSRLFPPVQVRSGGALSAPKFEGLQATKARVEAWIKATGARVLSVETVNYKVDFDGTGISFDKTYADNFQKHQFHVILIRVYFDGYYREPPPSALPPIPQIEESDCCTVL